MSEFKSKTYRLHNSWTWEKINIFFEDQQQVQEIYKDSPEFKVWYENAKNIKTTSLDVVEREDAGYALLGSLHYLQDPKDMESYQLIHFYLSESLLMTSDVDIEGISTSQEDDFLNRLDKRENAVQGFLHMVGIILNTFMDGIDQFEEKLINLEEQVRDQRSGNILEDIVSSRADLLLLKQLIIPMEEFVLGVEEAFLEKAGSNEYRRIRLSMERTLKLLLHYDSQIETLLSINMNVYSYRGNEIIKALTVFTVLVTPVTIFGALWGMNFKYMPEFKWELGYVFAWVVILGTTGLIYWWLHRKGWTGDVMRRREPGKLHKKKKELEEKLDGSLKK